MLLSAASRASEASVADFSNKNTARALSIDKKKRPPAQFFEKIKISGFSATEMNSLCCLAIYSC
jgi:hypothetical protein